MTKNHKNHKWWYGVKLSSKSTSIWVSAFILGLFLCGILFGACAKEEMQTEKRTLAMEMKGGSFGSGEDGGSDAIYTSNHSSDPRSEVFLSEGVTPSAPSPWVQLRRAKDAKPVEFPARVLLAPDASAVISPPLSARILAILAKPGDHVLAGDPIAKVVMPEADSAFAMKEASQASLHVLGKRREQMKALELDGLAKASELASLELEIAKFKGEALKADALLRGAHLSSAGEVLLRSPVSGTVAEIKAVVGEQRKPDDGPIARVRSYKGKRVEATFPFSPDPKSTYTFRSLSDQETTPIMFVSSIPNGNGTGFVAWFDAVGEVALKGGTEGRLLENINEADAYVVPERALILEDRAYFVISRLRNEKPARTPVSLVRTVSSEAIVRGVFVEGCLVATEPLLVSQQMPQSFKESRHD